MVFPLIRYSFFVVQKKPAITEGDVVLKISDSYRSTLGKGAFITSNLCLLQVGPPKIVVDFV